MVMKILVPFTKGLELLMYKTRMEILPLVVRTPFSTLHGVPRGMVAVLYSKGWAFVCPSELSGFEAERQNGTRATARSWLKAIFLGGAPWASPRRAPR